MFSKAALTFLLVGVLSVNALTLRVARSPAPEPEFQDITAWMLKRANDPTSRPSGNANVWNPWNPAAIIPGGGGVAQPGRVGGPDRPVPSIPAAPFVSPLMKPI